MEVDLPVPGNKETTWPENDEPTQTASSESGSTEPESTEPESTEPAGSESENAESESAGLTDPEDTDPTQPGDDGEMRDLAVKIFIDCDRCDMDYIREEIPYINYVRDVKEAQVYVLETRESTGSGGRKYTYAFVGQQEYEGKNDTLEYSSRPDDSRDYERIWRTQMLKMGLMPTWPAHHFMMKWRYIPRKA